MEHGSDGARLRALLARIDALTDRRKGEDVELRMALCAEVEALLQVRYAARAARRSAA
ncbi:hypothetical protein GCM10010968_06390 [Agrococcus terreus]|uniref:Uncharacterized protein n=1 Tax=Agrococcus terreus TaxID=574649 RepID=A0ABQ2KCK7_9MICO|nr:hypothetical protein GCM10010968_06390 [Agrococcus terreus]